MSAERSVSSRLDYFSAESMAKAAREQREKCRVLHEEWRKAHDAMVEASNQVEFLVRAKRAADEDYNELRHRVRELCEKQAMELIA